MSDRESIPDPDDNDSEEELFAADNDEEEEARPGPSSRTPTETTVGSRSNQNKAFECPKCHASYAHKISLTRHIKYDCGKTYTCDELLENSKVCGQICTTVGGLAEYKKKHAEQNERLPCPTCGRTYASLQNLKRHIRDMHSDNDRFPCTQCDHVAPNEGALQTHMRKHTAHNFLCDLCDYSSNQKRWLLNHVKECHSETGAPAVGENEPPSQDLMNSEDFDEDWSKESDPTVQIIKVSEKLLKPVNAIRNAMVVLVQQVYHKRTPHLKCSGVRTHECSTPEDNKLIYKHIVSKSTWNNSKKVDTLRLTNKDASFYFIGDVYEEQTNSAKAGVQLVQAFTNYRLSKKNTNYVLPKTDMVVSLTDWKMDYIEQILLDNNIKLLFLSEEQYMMEGGNIDGFNQYPSSDKWLSQVDKGFGHLYYAYSELDDTNHVYLGYNPNSTFVLAQCHKFFDRDSTALGKFRRRLADTQPQAKITSGILCYCGSAEKIVPLENAAIFSATLNDGGQINLPDITTRKMALLNEKLMVPPLTLEFLNVVKYFTYLLFKKRFRLEKTGPVLPMTDTTCVETFFPSALRFE